MSLADRMEILDLHTRLANLLDEGRFEDAGSVYTEDVEVHSPRGGRLRGLAVIGDYLRQSQKEGERTQHRTTDVLVDVAGDVAETSANSLVHFYRDGQPPHQTSGLRLTFTAVRTPAGWRFREARMALAWTRVTPPAAA